MQGQSSPERVELISVPVCRRSSCPIRALKRFALSKRDCKTFPSYSSSALFVSVPGYYFSIILIDFLKFYEELKFLFFSKISGWNF